MKILILQDYLRSGGTERQTIFLANFFQKKGYNTFVMTFRPGGVLMPNIKKFNIRHLALQTFDTYIDWFAPKLIRKIQEKKPNIVLCMGRIANIYGGYIQKKITNCFVIGTIRTGRSLPFLNKIAFKNVKIIVGNSNWWINELKRKGFNSKKIHIINNSLVRNWDLKINKKKRKDFRINFRANENTCVFLNVANFQSGKRQIELIKNCIRLGSTIDWQLWLVGHGSRYFLCKLVAICSSFRHRIKFIGYQEDPYLYYLAADVALSASLQDSQPNFLVEAQFMGLPVIAYDYRGVKDCFQSEKTGLLIPCKDHIKFLNAMIFLAKDHQFRTKINHLARSWSLNNFSKESQAYKYIKLFSLLTKNNNTSN